MVAERVGFNWQHRPKQLRTVPVRRHVIQGVVLVNQIMDPAEERSCKTEFVMDHTRMWRHIDIYIYICMYIYIYTYICITIYIYIYIYILHFFRALQEFRGLL